MVELIDESVDPLLLEGQPYFFPTTELLHVSSRGGLFDKVNNQGRMNEIFTNLTR